MQQRKRRPQKSVSETCPKCGYCDKCGRSNAAPVWPYPVPYVPPAPITYPWWFTPYRPYYQPNTTFPWATTVTVSGTSSAAAQSSYNPSVYNVSGLSLGGNDGLHVNTKYGTAIDPASTTSNISN